MVTIRSWQITALVYSTRFERRRNAKARDDALWNCTSRSQNLMNNAICTRTWCFTVIPTDFIQTTQAKRHMCILIVVCSDHSLSTCFEARAIQSPKESINNVRNNAFFNPHTGTHLSMKVIGLCCMCVCVRALLLIRVANTKLFLINGILASKFCWIARIRA